MKPKPLRKWVITAFAKDGSTECVIRFQAEAVWLEDAHEVWIDGKPFSFMNGVAELSEE